MQTFASFKREAAGRKCKLVKSEHRPLPTLDFNDVTAKHKTAHLERTIKKVRSDGIVFDINGKESGVSVSSASNYQPTPEGFIIACEYARLTYHWL